MPGASVARPAGNERPNTADLAKKAWHLLGSGRGDAARPIIAALRSLRFDPAGLAELEAHLRLREGRADLALAALDAAIATIGSAPVGSAPVGSISSRQAARLTILRAELRLKSGDAAGAASDAAAAIIAHPQDADAKAMLGLALMRLGRTSEAAACIAEACSASPERPEFQLALAQAQGLTGELEHAAATLEAAVAKWPYDRSLVIEAIVVAMRRGDFRLSANIGAAARARGMGDANLLRLLGQAFSALGEAEQALGPYREALQLAPGDPAIRHLAASAGLVAGDGHAPAAYIEGVFELRADRYEGECLDQDYRVPGLIRREIERLCERGGAAGEVLDLGCGTGLMGVMLVDLGVERLTGIDLAPRMIAQAAGRGDYHRLFRAEMLGWLATTRERWDVIVAAEALDYFGDLTAPFRAIAERLKPGGAFICSVRDGVDALLQAEPLQGEAAPAWRLHRDGGFRHSAEHVGTAAKSSALAIRDMRRETLRTAQGAPVGGFIVVLERDDADRETP